MNSSTKQGRGARIGVGDRELNRTTREKSRKENDFDMILLHSSYFMRWSFTISSRIDSSLLEGLRDLGFARERETGELRERERGKDPTIDGRVRISWV